MTESARSVVAGIDISTTGARAVLVDKAGRIIATGVASFTPAETTSLGRQEASGWVHAAMSAVRSARGRALDAPSVAAVGIASQGFTVAPISDDLDGSASALTWLSDPGSGEVVTRADAERLFELSGRFVTHASLLAQSRGRRHNAIATPTRWALVGEVVAAHLTNRYFADPCLASTTALLDPRTRDWSPELLSEAGLNEAQLPELAEVDTPRVRASSRGELTELGITDATVVVPPTQDQRAAVLIADPAGTSLTITSGTASVIAARVSAPLLDARCEIPLSPSLEAGFWEVEGVVGAAGASLVWAANAFGLGGVRTLLDAAATAPTGARGVDFLPHLGGATSPSWDASRTAELTGIRPDIGPADVARAVIEGVCREITLNARLVLDIAGQRDEIVFIGGLTQHPLVAAILAEMLERPIRVNPIAQPTALGAAARAGSAVGWDTPSQLGATAASASFVVDPATP